MNHGELVDMLGGLPLETGRLILRGLSLGDQEPFYRLCNNEEVLRYLPDTPLSREEVTSLLSWHMECYRRNRPDRIVEFCLGVVEKASGNLVGWCGLGPLDFEPDSVELFYGLDPCYWGRGYATEASRGLLTYAFFHLHLDQVSAVVKPENSASRRVIEKLGFELVGKVGPLPEPHAFYEDEWRYVLERERYLGSRTC